MTAEQAYREVVRSAFVLLVLLAITGLVVISDLIGLSVFNQGYHEDSLWIGVEIEQPIYYCLVAGYSRNEGGLFIGGDC